MIHTSIFSYSEEKTLQGEKTRGQATKVTLRMREFHMLGQMIVNMPMKTKTLQN